MSDKLFKKYHNKLAFEGVLKAVLCGLIIGFSFLAVLGALFWFMDWKSYWIGLIVWAVVSAVTGFAFYKLKFQPTTKEIALRIDELGLEERILTMTELDGDDSYIARRQREDAYNALNTVQASFLKIVVSTSVIVGVVLSGLAGLGLTTVSALTSMDLLPSGLELVEQARADTTKYTYQIEYKVQEELGGEIIGALLQAVDQGEDATPVIAVPEENFVFIAWSDGLQDPYRQDTAIKHEMTIYAIFLPIDEALDGEENAEKDDPPEGDPNQEAPESEIKIPTPTGSAKYEEVNQIIDGKTFYGDEYYNAAENTREEMTEGNYTDTQKEMVNGYLDGIETVVDEENND